MRIVVVHVRFDRARLCKTSGHAKRPRRQHLHDVLRVYIEAKLVEAALPTSQERAKEQKELCRVEQWRQCPECQPWHQSKKCYLEQQWRAVPDSDRVQQQTKEWAYCKSQRWCPNRHNHGEQSRRLLRVIGGNHVLWQCRTTEHQLVDKVGIHQPWAKCDRGPWWHPHIGTGQQGGWFWLVELCSHDSIPEGRDGSAKWEWERTLLHNH